MCKETSRNYEIVLNGVNDIRAYCMVSPDLAALTLSLVRTTNRKYLARRFSSADKRAFTPQSDPAQSPPSERPPYPNSPFFFFFLKTCRLMRLNLKYFSFAADEIRAHLNLFRV